VDEWWQQVQTEKLKFYPHQPVHSWKSETIQIKILQKVEDGISEKAAN